MNHNNNIMTGQRLLSDAYATTRDHQLPSSSVSKAMSSSPSITGSMMPHENDVVFGSGRTYETHLGNQCFKMLIQRVVPIYDAATKLGKSTIISAVMEYVKRCSFTGLGFLHKNTRSGEYKPASDHYTVSQFETEIDV